MDQELTSCFKHNREPDAHHTQICTSCDVEHPSEYDTTELGNDQTHQYTDERKREDLFEELKRNSSLINKDGLPARYLLRTERQDVDKDGHVRRWTFGKKDDSKKSRNIMLVGETGTGKTTLINSLVNYLLGVEKEDNVWFEISEDSEVNCAVSQTECITVYEVFTEASKVSLSIIDTPGYGNTRGLEYDKNISMWLQHFLDKITHDPLRVVGLVVTATQNHLHDRQLYIFDSVQSLFGSNIKENIVVFVTHATELTHRNALTAIEKANIPIAKINNEPVCFMYDNIQSDRQCTSKEIYNAKWEMGQRSTDAFIKILDTLETQSLEKSKTVLTHRKDLEKYVQQLKKCVASIHEEQMALEDLEEEKKCNQDYTYEAEEDYNEKVTMEVTCYTCCKYKVTSCNVCKENCHSHCWGICNPRRCRVMKKKKCTKCTGGCASDTHVTEHSKYVTKTKMVQKTNKEKEMNYKKQEQIIDQKKAELSKKRHEKLNLVERAYTCITELEKNALKCNTLLTQLHLEFLTEMMEETEHAEIVQKVNELRKRNDLEEKAMDYLKSEICDV